MCFFSLEYVTLSFHDEQSEDERSLSWNIKRWFAVNGFRDDASCCPTTCSVSRELCRSAQIHGSFTCSQHFKNKHVPINQSKTNRSGSSRGGCLPTQHKLFAVVTIS